ncbi:DUF4012 domain-containing protein [Arthrobacter cavernae]|uniref:DUF4012 domain-containing protein n=1 Tax=Arthrobacter cavernae TaxID=2817681 RepID=UPI0027DBBC52|nr:DUF4012 domain-containing protein [Arthrobacter cavernae]
MGANFSATAEIARSADDVANLGVAPLVKVFDSFDWNSLLPSESGSDLEPIKNAAPSVAAAAHAVRVSAERLEAINPGTLFPQVAEPLVQAREQLRAVSGTLDSAAEASRLAPAMLGSGETRRYLLLIQNNAEIRASGGIPTALAVLTMDKGKLTLGAQTTADGLGKQDKALPVDVEQERIYSTRLGTYMQDVNLTPDFPTAARTAQNMWAAKTGERLNGVISIDPIALGFILDSTGPVKLKDSSVLALSKGGLPTELTGKNVVHTLLSDVYAKIEKPAEQDAYFAAVAKEIFMALAGGQGNHKGLIDGIAKGVEQHRILLWSADAAEQSTIAQYPLSGSISGPSVPAAQFGVYFNDGTGAKMDYYVKRTAQLVRQCTDGDYASYTVRVTSTNTAPADAATSLPKYVTAGGAFGVPAGSAQSNIMVYGPVQSNVETVAVNGKKSPFGANHHAERPVGTVTVTLAPGQSTTVDFTFSRIVQHTESELLVTPTVDSVTNVIRDTEILSCESIR